MIHPCISTELSERVSSSREPDDDGHVLVSARVRLWSVMMDYLEDLFAPAFNAARATSRNRPAADARYLRRGRESLG
jgi:hypothetical protein